MKLPFWYFGISLASKQKEHWFRNLAPHRQLMQKDSVHEFLIAEPMLPLFGEEFKFVKLFLF